MLQFSGGPEGDAAGRVLAGVQQEALAIADEIAGLLKDERFKSRTLGVVSLLGLEQAKHIDSVVRQRCDAAGAVAPPL